MANSFLITSTGRTGTKFLAWAMNHSPTWTVRHEPEGGPNRKGFRKELQKRLRRENYGEVNCRTRYHFDKVDVSRRGVILRRFSDVRVSHFNKDRADHKRLKRNRSRLRQGQPGRVRVPEQILPTPAYYAYEAEIIDKYVQSGVIVARYELMTTSIAYLRQVMELFGVTDVEVTHEMMTTRINSRAAVAVTLADLPRDMRVAYHVGAGWFDEKYYNSDGSVRDDCVPNPVRLPATAAC